MTEKTQELYPKTRSEFEDAVKTALEVARYAIETRGYFDPVNLSAGRGIGYVYKMVRGDYEAFVALAGLGADIPADMEAHIRRLNYMGESDTLTYLGAVDGTNYEGRNEAGDEVSYRLAGEKPYEMVRA